MFLQNSDDLLFREAAALRVLVLSMGQNELRSGLERGGNVTHDVNTRLHNQTAKQWALAIKGALAAGKEGWVIMAWSFPPALAT
jgi:hypothetical protein